MTELGEFAMFLAVGFTSLGLLFGPIGTAVGRRLSGRSGAPGGGAELDELRARLAELEAAQHQRLAEVEERLDFAERLLAQRADQGLLAPAREEPS